MKIKTGILDHILQIHLDIQNICAEYRTDEFAGQKTNSTMDHTKGYMTIGGNCFNK